MSMRRYRAFISYSHRDESWARWLHRALEGYRIPRKLVGAQGIDGDIPARLRPVFRDRDDLSSAADLPGKVKEALANSEALIVVCSPAAASSRWVNEEIREFRRLGRSDRIFGVVVEGDPQATGADACFPPALMESEAGATVEPLAADARKWADGRLLAKLKLLSGILGIPLDSLRRRDLQRRQRMWVATTIAAVALALIVTLAVTSRVAAEKRRAFAEELVGFKLSDLGGRLKLESEQDLLARLEYWEEASKNQNATPSTEAAIERAREFRAAGMDKRRRGDHDGALVDFQQSWLTLALRLQQDPSDRQVLFELGQAEFYISQVHMELGAFEKSERASANYAEVSRRLLRAEPENAEWVLEMAYALTNLGRFEVLRKGTSSDRALQFMQSALEFNQIALVLDPGNEAYRSELEQSHANVADAQMRVCDLGGALHSRMENTRLAREFFRAAPNDERKKRLLAYALGGLAGVQESVGLAELALGNLQESAALMEALQAEHPENVRYSQLLTNRNSRALALLAHTGKLEDARAALGPLQEAWEQYLSSEESAELRRRTEYAEFLLTWEQIEAEIGDPAAAAEHLQRALDQLVQVVETSPDLGVARERLALAVYRYWERNGELPALDVEQWLPQVAGVDPYNRGCQEINLAARLSVMRGDLPAAESYTSYLLEKGYFEPGFVQFCRSQGLCAL